MFQYGYHMTGWGYGCAGFGLGAVVLALLAIGAVAVIGVVAWGHQHWHTGAPATAARDDGTHAI